MAKSSKARGYRSRLWPIFGAGAIVVATTFIGLGALVEIKLEQRQALDQFTRQGQDNADWAVHELEAERAKLEIALLKAQSGDPMRLASALQRYEIFASRLPVLAAGLSGSTARSMPAYPAASTATKNFLDRFDPKVAGGIAVSEIAPMLEGLEILEKPIRALSIQTIHARAESDRSTRERIAMFERDAFLILAVLISLIAGFAGYALLSLRRAYVSEQNLMESEKRLLDFAHVASDWYWETDTGHRLLYVSDTGGIEAQPLVGDGKTLEELLQTQSDDQDRASPVADRLRQRKPFRDLRIKALGQDGIERHLSIAGTPYFSNKGRFLGYRGTARDITRDIETEKTLSAALREAQVANNAKLSFLANMSHELRTPLNAIIGFSEALQFFAKDQLDQRQLGYLHDIQASGQHLLELINSILEISRLDVGRMHLSKEIVSVAEIAFESARMLESAAQKSGVKIHCRHDLFDLPAVHADRLRLRQIFLNLLANAVKYTPQGGEVCITGGLEPDHWLRVDVNDTGIGMAPEDLAVALRPFERIDSPLTRKREGIGLGLPIANSLVREHGGTLAIKSALGQGTSVSIRLPLPQMNTDQTSDAVTLGA